MSDISFDAQAHRRRAAIGLVAGTAIGWFVFFLIFALFAGPAAASKADRLGYVAQWLLPVAILIMVQVFAVAIMRNFSPAMDPTTGVEPRYLDVSRRALTNTVEQSLIFALLAFAVAAAAPAGQLAVFAALTVMFVASRLVFWGGYLIGSPWRTLGVMTMQINIVMAVWAVIAVLGYQPFWLS